MSAELLIRRADQLWLNKPGASCRLDFKNMNTLLYNFHAIPLSKINPTGYILPNGVVSVWKNGVTQNNLSTIEKAREMFPNLQIIEFKNADTEN